MNTEILSKVATLTNINQESVKSVITMMEEGSTIPFIARYRKEVTHNLDEEQLRNIALTYEYQDKLFIRKNEVLSAIMSKGKLTPALEKEIKESDSLHNVEELYLPFKEKRKTRATIAIAKGLEPLAEYLLQFLNEDYRDTAETYLNEEVVTMEDAIAGAQDIIAERFSDDHVYRDIVRTYMYREALIKTTKKKDAVDEKKVYENYYEYQEPLRFVAHHRLLAMNRGENLDILKIKIEMNDVNILNYLANRAIPNWNSPAAKIIKEAIKDAYTRLIFPSIEREVRNDLTAKAHEESIQLFSENLSQLLLTPPLKNIVMLGVDPAFRTGCKLAIVNGNGDFIKKSVIYPHEKYIGEHVPPYRLEEAKKITLELIKEYQVQLIAIGNGTASRETEEFIATLINENHLDTKYIIVSEAGASVYSASTQAKEEFPDLQVEERSAISIARRVLDPLAELIKIEPRSIGVGQYQHDVNQTKLNESLDFTILKVVNHVGVNLNSASTQLLSYVSGLSKRNAQSIIDFRKEQKKIHSRDELKKVKGIGPKTYQQAIGFLKILDSKNPLDKTFIHPDDYEKVEKLLAKLDLTVQDIGSSKLQQRFDEVNVLSLAKECEIGEYSAIDIISELQKPLRDIREEYPTPTLRSDVLHIEELKIGMKVQGTVRSIVDFGVFVDIGLKNDGMIHKSKLTRGKIRHPLDICSIGDIVDVYIIDVDITKQRVGLSLLDPNTITPIHS